MRILVPVDGSEVSVRALRFAADLAREFEGTVHVVHITDVENDATARILDRARTVLEEEGIDDVPEVTTDVELDLRPATRVGEDILELVRERNYDHVVMGHHGVGHVDRFILGSAAETVLRSCETPVTVIP
ncbi:MAG: universal stress protein [Halobacteriaceae archaeon]